MDRCRQRGAGSWEARPRVVVEELVDYVHVGINGTDAIEDNLIDLDDNAGPTNAVPHHARACARILIRSRVCG